MRVSTPVQFLLVLATSVQALVPRYDNSTAISVTSTTRESTSTLSSKDVTSTSEQYNSATSTLDESETSTTSQRGDGGATTTTSTSQNYEQTATTTSSQTSSDKPSYGWNSTQVYESHSATVTTSLPASVSAQLFPSYNPKWVLQDNHIPTGKPDLTQQQTNGDCPLGTFEAPTYELFVGAGQGQPQSYPWGGATTQNTNPYQDPPNTGVTRSYNFVVERGILAPDGVERSVMLVNGQFPGPTIEADWGDTIEVTVTNKITGPEEGTAFHWHGLLQKGTQFMDGVPGIMQCPIAPGESFTYSFQADLYGTSWWHAHYSAQYAAGLFGAMVIHGPTQVNYDVDLGPILISDYYHEEYFSIIKKVMGTDISKAVPHSDNNLINGKGLMNCSFVSDSTTCNENAGLSKFQFEQGKTYRLRLINSGAEGIQKFSIDNHKLSVIAYDYVPIVPHEATVVTLGVGQRADVLVTANGQSGDAVWMRSSMTKCANTFQPNALAMIYYNGADTDSVPQSSAWPDNTDPCANDDISSAVPYYTIAPSEPDLEIEIELNFGINGTGQLVFLMNNSTFRTNYNNPILPLAHAQIPVSEMPEEWNVYDVGTSKSVRVTVNNLTPIIHPMHMHGHNMYILSSTSGPGVSLTNLQNPTRRDVHLLPPNGTMVMQFDGDNPGVWPFHCHIAWHVSAGLYVNFLENQAAIPSTAPVDGLCQSWSAYTATDVVDQIDSGL